jgi:hypothetical protein
MGNILKKSIFAIITADARLLKATEGDTVVSVNDTVDLERR